MPPTKGEEIAFFLMADGQMARAEDYVNRGRRFERLSSNELRNQHSAAFRAWAADGFKLTASYSDQSDLSSEHDLRGLDLDLSDLHGEIESMSGAIQAVYNETSEERREEIGAEMIDAYLAAQTRKM